MHSQSIAQYLGDLGQNMIGLIAYLAIGVWCFLGWHVCRYLITKRVRELPLKWTLVLLFWVVWLVGPISDELVGRRVFDDACAVLPAASFFGPVHIGAGAFFDERGVRRWNDEKEFAQIRVSTNEWQRIFEWRSTKTEIARLPVPITRTDTVIFHVASNTPSVSSSSLLSTGGWIRRAAGWGYHAAWTCQSPGSWPRDEDRILF